jgi:hypothetical protein
MGWCSATIIFDQIAEAILTDHPIDKQAILTTVVEALEDGDWDCQQDSEYWNHPIVQKIMRQRHPRWFEGE